MTHKQTKGKIQLNLVPPHAYEAIAKVRMFGNEKYGDPWGWKEHCKSEDFIEAAKRHLNTLAKGVHLDDESGLPHLHHALCSLAMAAELQECSKTVYTAKELKSCRDSVDKYSTNKEQKAKCMRCKTAAEIIERQELQKAIDLSENLE